MIFQKFSHRWPLLGVVALISGGLLLGQVAAGRTEPYLRVHKNGVIYYYFSSRGEKKTGPEASPTEKIREIRPVTPNKPAIQDLEEWIREASLQHRLPPSLIKAVIQVESNFNPDATSPKGAQGLMQLMPGTADGLQVANPYDPRENIAAGTRYLRLLLEKFDHRLPLALAAYNAGPQRVDQSLDVPPIKETQDFVHNVCVNFLKYTREQSPKSSAAAP